MFVATINDINHESKRINFTSKFSFVGFITKKADNFLTNKLEIIYHELLGIQTNLEKNGISVMNVHDYTVIKSIRKRFLALSDLPSPQFYNSIIWLSKVIATFDQIINIYDNTLFNWEDYDTTHIQDESEWELEANNHWDNK